MNIVKKILLCMVLVAFASPLFAEDNPPENMQILLEKIRADKKLLVAENMQLSDKESKAFWPVYEKYQSELFLIRVRTVKLINDYAENYEKMTNAAAKKLIDEYMTIETLRLKLAKAYLPEFRKALPDTKVARYYQIENKINAALYYELATKIPLLKTETP